MKNEPTSRKLGIVATFMGDDFAWCSEHRCYHGLSGVPYTHRVVLAMVYDRFKLTTRQARRHGLAINQNVVFIPKRDRRVQGGWVLVRFHWRMDGSMLCLEPPDETGAAPESELMSRIPIMRRPVISKKNLKIKFVFHTPLSES